VVGEGWGVSYAFEEGMASGSKNGALKSKAVFFVAGPIFLSISATSI
jgi:hypothetical protein